MTIELVLNATERAELIAKIRLLPSQVEQFVAGLSAEQLLAHPLAGEWSVAQNVHHLVDSHMNSYIRLRLILTEENPPLKPYRQDDWAALADAGLVNLSPSLTILHGLHTRWATLFESLTDQQWLRTGVHPEYGVLSALDLLQSYVRHGEGHLDQMARTLAAQ